MNLAARAEENAQAQEKLPETVQGNEELKMSSWRKREDVFSVQRRSM